MTVIRKPKTEKEILYAVNTDATPEEIYERIMAKAECGGNAPMCSCT